MTDSEAFDYSVLFVLRDGEARSANTIAREMTNPVKPIKVRRTLERMSESGVVESYGLRPVRWRVTR